MDEANREGLIQTGLAVGAGLLTLPVLAYPFGFDQAIYATIADVMGSGGRPYVDAWEMRPPAIFYLYEIAFAIFGRSEWSIRIFDLIAMMAAAPALYRIGRDAAGHRGVGTAAALLVPLLYDAFGFWDTAQPEAYMIPFLAWAMRFWLRDDRPLAAGLCLGGAILFKHSIGLVPLVMAVVLARRDWRASLKFAGGVASPLALLAIVALASGWFGAMMRETVGYASHHAATGWRHGPIRLASHLWSQIGAAFHPACLVAAVAGGAIGWRAAPARRLIAWGLLAFVTVVVQAKFFVYQFLPLVPFVALLASLTLLWPRKHFAIAAIVLIAGAAAWRTRVAWREAAAVPTQGLYKDCADIAGHVKSRTNRVEKIFVWGNAPQVYFLSDRRPATRYPILVPAVVPWVGDDRVREIVAKLREERPFLIVTVRRDALVDVSLREEDSEELIGAFPPFGDLLRERYEPVGALSRFQLWQRR